jgi:hypothetical protein
VRGCNPFRGFVAVVECTDARAIGLDGRSWQIQVLWRAERAPASSEVSAADRSRAARCRFGFWSEAEGLVQLPVNQPLNMRAMRDACEALLGHLPNAQRRLP